MELTFSVLNIKYNINIKVILRFSTELLFLIFVKGRELGLFSGKWFNENEPNMKMILKPKFWELFQLNVIIFD